MQVGRTVRKIIFLSICLLFSLKIAPFAYAGGIAHEKGIFTIQYKGKKISSAEKYKAYQGAQQNALVRYFAQSGSSETSNFTAIENKIKNNLSFYVIGTRIISQENHPSMKMYTVVVRVDLNVSALNNALKSSSIVGKANQSEKSTMTFIFVARQVVSKKNFKTRKYRRANLSISAIGSKTLNHVGTEGQSLGGSQIGVSSSNQYSGQEKYHGSAVSETGGSNLRQATQYKYTIMNSQFLNSVFSGDFAKAGFQVVNVASVAPYTNGFLDLRLIKKEYGNGNNITPRTLNNAFQGLLIAKVPYVAFGTLDVGLTEKDPVTGLDRVFVTVTGILYDLSSRFPVTIASVGPIQYSGTGPTENVARMDALKLAANKAANKLISQINVAGVH